MHALKLLTFLTIALGFSIASAEAAEPGKDGFIMTFSAIGPSALSVPADEMNFDSIIGFTPFIGIAADAASAAFGARLSLSDQASVSIGYSLGMAPYGGLAPSHSLTLGFRFKF